MKTKLLFTIFSTVLYGCSDGEQLSQPRKSNPALEFHQAKSEEIPGWTKTQFRGSPIWINPTIEMDASEIASAKLERTPHYEKRKKEEERIRAELEKTDPDVSMGSGLSEYSIYLRFTKSGSKAFRDVTAKCIGNQLAIMHQGEVLIAPTVYEPIASGVAQISSSIMSKAELEALLKEINAE